MLDDDEKRGDVWARTIARRRARMAVVEPVTDGDR